MGTTRQSARTFEGVDLVASRSEDQTVRRQGDRKCVEYEPREKVSTSAPSRSRGHRGCRLRCSTPGRRPRWASP